MKNGTKTQRKTAYKYDTLPKKTAWLLLIAFIIIGTVFTFGMRYWQAPVTRDEAIQTQAVFASCKELRGSRRSVTKIKSIEIFFEDREPLNIDGSCCGSAVLEKLSELRPGAELQMYVHPNSDTILELRTQSDTILDFDTASSCLSYNRTGFTYLGIFMYIAAAAVLVKIVKKETC